MIEQMLPHEPNVALQLVRLHREVFVEVERDDVAERQAFILMQPYEFAVDAYRRAAGRQAKDAVAALLSPLANQDGNLRRHRLAGFARMPVHAARDLLAAEHLV